MSFLFALVVFNVICVICSGWRMKSCDSGRRRILRLGANYHFWKNSGKIQTSQVYIVLTPEFEGYFNGKSLPAYGRMGKVTLDVFHFHSRNKFSDDGNYWYDEIVFAGIPHRRGGLRYFLETSARIWNKQLPLKISDVWLRQNQMSSCQLW